MKKEIIIGVLFLAMIAGAVLSNRYVKKLTDEVVGLSEAAAESARNGDWDEAVSFAQKACDTWEKHNASNHMILRHGVVESAEAALNAHLGFIRARKLDEATGSARTVKSLVKGIGDAERIHLGSIL